MLSFNVQSSQATHCMPSLSTQLRVFRKWLARSPAEASAAVAMVRDKILPTLWQANEPLEPQLAKSHWRLASEVSSETFFQNKYGFPPQEVLLEPVKTQTLLLRNVQSPQLQFARGFKTRRSTTVGGPIGSSKANPKVDEEAKDTRVADAESYIAGYEAGKEAERSGSATGSSAKSKRGFMEKVQKAAPFLITLAFLMYLIQSSNIQLRISRVSNEIAPEDIDVTFDDVKGCDEAKQELQEIVDFLKNPEKFSALGGKLPKGCLLVGRPGTGKTLLARAVAGQAGVPFFHASGSEFDEVLVGQGAKRVRDLFKTAKMRAPCVIFIDEIDSVGAKRTNSVLHPYANQTINQLLSEMDGFLSNEGVIVLGATNRADDLDRALLRPGRFDTQVEVPAPDMKGRREILTLYLGKIKHDASVNVNTLAKMTVGFTGADLENMVNTAAIRAATAGKEWVTMAEFEYSHDKHVLGTDWKSRVRDKEDLKITAYHEAGHTLVAYFTEYATPIHKVTIVAKGSSGGHTAFLPENDRVHETKAQLLAHMDVGMGGRAAEELIFGKDKVTGGASSDLQKATSIAELITKKLGMSDKLGLRVIPDREGFAPNELSPQTAEIIDSEITKLLNTSYDRAMAILKQHRHELDVLADTLLKYETLDAEDIKSIIEGNTKKVAQKMAASNQVLEMNRRRQQQGLIPAHGLTSDALA